MSADVIEQLSDALADRIATAAPIVVAIGTGHGHRSGILWRPDVVVASEQVLGEQTELKVRHAGGEVTATLVGRDTGTNVAALRLAQPLTGVLPAVALTPRVGSLALVVGADARGAATAVLRHRAHHVTIPRLASGSAKWVGAAPSLTRHESPAPDIGPDPVSVPMLSQRSDANPAPSRSNTLR